MLSAVCRLPEVKILVRNPEGKFPCRIQRHKGEDNIKVDLKEIDFEDVCMCLSCLFIKAYPHMLIKSNQMLQYADIHLMYGHSTCFGCHSTCHQEY